MYGSDVKAVPYSCDKKANCFKMLVIVCYRQALHNSRCIILLIQAANADLQNRLYKSREKEKFARENYVDPDELRHRLDEVMRGIRSGRVRLD